MKSVARERRRVVEGRGDAAAPPVAHDHDGADAEREHGVLEGGAEAPWLRVSGAYTGTSAATLRTTNSSPGRASKTVSGPDRESEHATTIVGGRWPSSARRS